MKKESRRSFVKKTAAKTSGAIASTMSIKSFANVNEIKKLCSMSIDELRGWYQNLIPILEHNKSFLESDSSQFDKLLKRI